MNNIKKARIYQIYIYILLSYMVRKAHYIFIMIASTKPLFVDRNKGIARREKS